MSNSKVSGEHLATETYGDISISGGRQNRYNRALLKTDKNRFDDRRTLGGVAQS